jgi:hypothetical protein
MYGALWRVLPGPIWLRILILLVGAAAILTALVLWVFPLIQPLVTPPESTVGGE